MPVGLTLRGSGGRVMFYALCSIPSDPVGFGLSSTPLVKGIHVSKDSHWQNACTIYFTTPELVELKNKIKTHPNVRCISVPFAFSALKEECRAATPDAATADICISAACCLLEWLDSLQAIAHSECAF